MTKVWDTTQFDSFQNEIKKYSKNTINKLETVSKQQQAFSGTNKGMKSKTFDGAKAYMGEVHPSIIGSINRALDEYVRVVGKLGSDFEDNVDAAGDVKIDTDQITQLNTTTDRKVEDVYQAHAELQKRIDTCNSESNTMPIVAPLFGPLETNMNELNTHLIKVKDKMDEYDGNHANALNAYHQLVEATRKAIDAAKTNYTAANGAINYQSGAFGSSPEGKALSNANYQLEAAKLAELYEVNNGNLDNMADYANELLQDPARLEQEMAYLKYLLENRAFPDEEEKRSQLTAFYYLLIQLKNKKRLADTMSDGSNFRVNDIELVKTGKSNVELNGSCQYMSPEEFEIYYSKYVNPSYGTKDSERKRFLDDTFVIKHFNGNVDAQVDNDENEDLRKQMEANKGNWVIPMVAYGVGFIPVAGQVFSVVGTVGDAASVYSENERIKNKITKDNLVNTADKFAMTCTITTNTTEKSHTVDVAINPTKETNDIMKRWKERAKVSKEVKFPEEMNYLQLHEYYLVNEKSWSSADEDYIFKGVK
ncbi:hypothetical protein HCJ58_10065 [Listeria sp. FSL L7-1509]|uniref:LXG domain-containing protein n=1 Tax=Listeria immobilis TaxID=2713502 RepID=A0ABR6SY64_9LIST|nr:T7SS effector LXG polymorphic toxin [Listeria immobilis]MBC1507303.1 hypothetical protein [Listeria immobilis]MBC1510631.1 hypothetical protein [Listeria immobilis]MBC6313163.1 hypothetical protein [Listeria immobilis]